MRLARLVSFALAVAVFSLPAAFNQAQAADASRPLTKLDEVGALEHGDALLEATVGSLAAELAEMDQQLPVRVAIGRGRILAPVAATLRTGQDLDAAGYQVMHVNGGEKPNVVILYEDPRIVPTFPAAPAAAESRAIPTSVDVSVWAIGSAGPRCCTVYFYEFPSRPAAARFAANVATHGLWSEAGDEGIQILTPPSVIYSIKLQPIAP